MTGNRWTVFAALVCLGAVARADISAVKAEPKLEKRAERALANAATALKSAETAYRTKGDVKQTAAALHELSESVELAYTSLKETGKNPSRSPKHFKRAEIKTRELLRRLRDFSEQMSVDDRASLEEALDVVQRVHDDLLQGIMGGKKR